MSYISSKSTKKIIKQTNTKTELIDVILWGIEQIKSQNTLIQQSICNQSNPNNSVAVDVSRDLEANIKKLP